MHIVVSWDIAADGQKWNDLNQALRTCISGHSWVKPLSTLYIVQIGGVEDRVVIKDQLRSICKQNPKTVHLIVSPAIEGGGYGGWLPKRLWPKIRKRTEG